MKNKGMVDNYGCFDEEIDMAGTVGAGGLRGFNVLQARTTGNFTKKTRNKANVATPAATTKRSTLPGSRVLWGSLASMDIPAPLGQGAVLPTVLPSVGELGSTVVGLPVSWVLRALS